MRWRRHGDPLYGDGPIHGPFLTGNDRARMWRAANPERLAAVKRRHYEENRERIIEQQRGYRERDPEGVRRRSRERNRAYRERHGDRVAQRSREWRKANEARQRANRQRWVANNKVRLAELEHRRRSRKRGLTIVVPSAEQLLAKFAYWGNRCWICRATEDLTLDHVKPLSAGGAHVLANMRPACRSCNSRKGAKWPFDQRQG
jgi:5-methylcytosine-specific restriction endonuclease McrA